MKKIIWISSYPKSGNTWVRYFLSSYFYNTSKKNQDLNILDKIDKFPPYKYLKKIVDKESLDKSAYEISNYWSTIQSEIIKSEKKFIFLKNHNALVSINENELIDEKNSLGIIHIVRDPRDIVMSYSKFDKTLSINKIIDRMTTKNLYCHRSKIFPLDIEVLGSWKFNYLSWRDGVKSIPRIIIKYEDLIKKTYKTKYRIIKFLSKIINFKVDTNQIKFSIDQSNFNRLKKLEDINGFKESESKFFNSGKIGQWKKYLSQEQIDRIENCCLEEMIELGYLKE